MSQQPLITKDESEPTKITEPKRRLPKPRLTKDQQAQARAEARTRSADWSYD